MKKRLLTFLTLTLTTVTFPYIAYDHTYKRIYSHPQSHGIDQDQYQRLVIQLFERIGGYLTNGKHYEKSSIAANIKDYLHTLDTPTAIRLLEDISSGGLYPLHLVFAVYGAILRDGYWYGKTRLQYKSGANEKNVAESELILLQLGSIVITCWNSGIYGFKVQKQIISYLKQQNTPIALEILSLT